MQDITDRVARGAALLDEKVPDWVDRIDLDKLDLSSTCRCILGQTWDGDDDPDSDATRFELHASRLFSSSSDFDDEANYGFDSDFPGDEFPALTAEWTRVILARRAEALKSGAK